MAAMQREITNKNQWGNYKTNGNYKYICEKLQIKSSKDINQILTSYEITQ